MVFSLHYIDTAVQCKDSHLIQFISILFRICLTECYQLIINEYRKFQFRTEFLLEFRISLQYFYFVQSWARFRITCMALCMVVSEQYS